MSLTYYEICFTVPIGGKRLMKMQTKFVPKRFKYSLS